MSDLISKSALIEELQKYFVKNSIHKNDLAQILANLPTVEAKPVVKGEWFDFDIDYGGIPAVGYQCSECGQSNGFFTYFCPNCGADMRKKVE